MKRMNLKKISVLLLTICMMSAIALTGCGSKDVPEDETVPSSSAPAKDQDNGQNAPANDQDNGQGASNEFSPVGSWKLTQIKTADDTVMTPEEYYAQQGVDTEGVNVDAIYTFAEDGSFTASIGGIETGGTYTVSGETVTVTVAETGASTSMTYDASVDGFVATDPNSGMASLMTRV